MIDDPTQVRDPLIGVTLGGYVVKHWIGEGGMGVVYLAEQPHIGKAVAIKILKPEIAADPEHLQRLIEEARTVNQIRHRGIIDIYAFGTTPERRQFIVMEYLEGQPLDGYLAGHRRVPPAEAISLLDEVLSALEAAHRAGVVHRDLKPGNIFVAIQADGSRYVKVLDFGLAKKATRPYGSAAQTSARPIGTPEYMAPEQARGANVSPRTDLYAVGVIAFEMLTGDLPFQAPSLVETLMAQMEAPVPSLRARESAIPPSLEGLVLDLLEKDPEARPASAAQVRVRLRQISRDLTAGGHPSLALPLSGENPIPPLPPEPASLKDVLEPAAPSPQTARATLPRASPKASRGWWLAGGAAAGLLGLVGAALFRPDASPPPLPAPAPLQVAVPPRVPAPSVAAAAPEPGPAPPSAEAAPPPRDPPKAVFHPVTPKRPLADDRAGLTLLKHRLEKLQRAYDAARAEGRDTPASCNVALKAARGFLERKLTAQERQTLSSQIDQACAGL